jgi:glycosyltransferase involved in cell wall biosynthesis
MCREFPPAFHGGTGSIMYEMAKLLQSKNNDMYITSSYFCEKFEESNIKSQYKEDLFSKYIEKIPISSFDSIYYAYRAGNRANKLLKLNKIDIVEAPSHGAESLFYSINKSIPLVIRLHGFISKIPLTEIDNSINKKQLLFTKGPETQLFRNYINKKNQQIMWELEKKALLNADVLICPSMSVKNFILNEISEVDENNLKLIYNGIDCNIFDEIQPQEENIRKKYNIQNESKLICFVGRVIKPKGVETLIRSIPYVLSKYRNVTFVFVGPLIDKSLIELSKNINSSIDRKKIIFTNRINRKDVYNLLKISDIVVHPSLYEVLPTVILEAMASKKPVVASDISPHKELIKNCKNGFLFETNNYKDLADKILELLFDPDKSKKMGIKGYEITSRYFSITKNCEESLKIYNSLI